jgi:short-subunit dehydrogenase
MWPLKGRAALLVGAAGGIGPFIARALAKEGLNLVLASRSGDELDRVLRATLKMNVKAIGIETDIRNVAALEVLVRAALAEFGAIDVLVNNAGINNILPYHCLTIEDVQRIMQVNLTSPMLLTKLLLPSMLTNRYGHIVNIASLAGEVGTPFCEAYGASKSGLIGFTRSLRLEYRPLGVSASVICPGFVRTGQYQKFVQETNLEAPIIVGTSHPEDVSRSVIRAIKHDVGYIMVSPIRTKFFVKASSLSPALGELLMNLLGVVRWLKDVGEKRESQGLRQDTRPS